MSMQHDEDLEYVRRSAADARKALSAANRALDRARVNALKEEAQYFEKLTIGTGAAIAAMVSYLGTHTTLYPKWILRCSLVSLMIAMLAALYRTWSYPKYVIATKWRRRTEAEADEQRCRHAEYEVEFGTVLDEDLLTAGAPVNLETRRKNFAKADAELTATATKQIKKQKRLWTRIKFSEKLCFVALGTAMASLVWLAIRNF
jgi:hypothetical protein